MDIWIGWRGLAFFWQKRIRYDTIMLNRKGGVFLNDIVYELQSEINEKRKQKESCTNREEEKNLKETVRTLRLKLARYCIDTINQLTIDIKKPGELIKKREILDKIQDYYGAYDKRTIPDSSLIGLMTGINWVNFLDSYEHITEWVEEILVSRAPGSGMGKHTGFNPDEIKKLKKQLRDAHKLSKEVEDVPKLTINMYRDCKIELIRLEAELLVEKQKEIEAIEMLEELLENPIMLNDTYWRSSVHCQIAEIYRKISFYNFAIEAYEKAANVITDERGKDYLPAQIEFIEEQKQALYLALNSTN